MKVCICNLHNVNSKFSDVENNLSTIHNVVAEAAQKCKLLDLSQIMGNIKYITDDIKILNEYFKMIINEYNDTECKIINKGGDANTSSSNDKQSQRAMEYGEKELEEYLKKMGWSEEEIKEILEYVKMNYPGMLSNLYILNIYSSSSFEDAMEQLYLLCEKNRYNNIVAKISEYDVNTYDDMMNLDTYDLLARMIYQEMQNPSGGSQNDVLWATVNRYFSEKNFTNGKEQTLRNILIEGGYESIDDNNGNKYNAYHPDYDSEGWENAKQLAAALYSQIGEADCSSVNENEVRSALESSCDIYGNNIENNIGDCDSFYGDGSQNYFYEY